MSNIIRIKRRLDDGVALSGAPTQGSLLNAELAYNEVDETLYYGKGEGQDGVAQEVVSIGGTGYIQRTVEFASSQLSSQMQSNFETLTGQIDSLSQEMETAVTNEATARSTADSALSGAIDTLNTKVENVLNNVDADALDSLTEIVNAFQTADNTLSGAITQLANAATSNLDAVSAAVAAAMSAEVTRATAAEEQIASDLADEIVRATGAEAGIQSSLDSEVSTRGSEITRVEGLVSAEQSARETAVSGVQSALDSEVTARETAVAGVQSSLDSEVSTRGSEITRVEGLVSAEQSARELAVSDLSSAVESEIASLSADMISRDAAALAEAKGYTDTAISDLVGGAPELLNTLKELASAIGDDENYFVHMAEQIAALSAATTTGLSDEVTRATAAEVALGVRIDGVVSDLTTETNRALAAEGNLADDIADEETRALAAESALAGRATDIEGNYLDKRAGGTVDADLTVTGNFEVGTGTATLFVEAGKVGINTETPSEALDVVGNGKFSGNLMGTSGTSEITGFIMDGGSF